MQFKNQQNTPHTDKEGVTRWHSRAIAVSATLLSEDNHILVTQRAACMAHHPLKWCIPCGYLDWNESIHQAIIREIWEEVGLDITGFPAMLYHINDDPARDELQNVSFHFLIHVPKSHKDVVLDLGHEVKTADWISTEDISNQNFGDKEFAFNHADRLYRQSKLDPAEAFGHFALHQMAVLDLEKPTQFPFYE